MIWYILYPLRGTTDAPALDASHPVRDAFTRYGRYAARHAVTTLLVSAAVATGLIYPIPFLFTTDFTNGASNLPHHVWTDAKPLAYASHAEPDVIMRSIWVHGSYMQALDKSVLSSALELQDELLGPTRDFSPLQTTAVHQPPSDNVMSLTPAQRDAVHVINGLTNASWFFHSPLLYWGCSRDRILNDGDIISTVNDKKNQSTSVNVTLRHSIVFSGKRFEDRRLLAADALVITLLHLRDSPVGRQWEAKAVELASKAKRNWDVYPPDGRISTSHLFEFQFRPMSMQDSVILALAYGLTFFYFLFSLSKLRAFKSKIGLMVTVVFQSALAIISSFTICAIFNIDLSRIPQAAYPLAVLSMSLENIFRLINAVILNSSEEQKSNRIGHAFGETAHIALASTIQNVLILIGLSRIVSPGVAAFCVFAAVAIVLDFFFLSTFFLSVLSVDVRRTELSDALAKASIQRNHRKNPDTRNRSSWLEQILQGNIALSTRIAGTIVMIGFVLIAQWHFFDKENMVGALLRRYQEPKSPQNPGLTKRALLEEVHQARSPTSWLRLQDHETAREVINIIKPSSHSYVARVYEPLVFVMKNSNRTPPTKEPSLLPAAYDFIHHELTRFVAIIIVIVAALRLLTSYLLWEDEARSEEQNDPNDTRLLSVKSLSGGHLLDVVMLAAATDGHVVSVGLDRLVRVWDIRSGGPSYVIKNGEQVGDSLFPILAIATDESSTWLAILSPFHVTFWNLKERSMGLVKAVDTGSQRPEAFFFISETPGQSSRLVLVRRSGVSLEICVATGDEEEFLICNGPLVNAQPLLSTGTDSSSYRPMVVAISRQGCLCFGIRDELSWSSRTLVLDELARLEIQQIIPIPALRLLLVPTGDKVFLVTVDEPTVMHTFHTDMMQARPLAYAYTCHRSSRPDAICLTMFTLCYTMSETGECVAQIYAPPEGKEWISLQRDVGLGLSDQSWCTWSMARELKRKIHNPGVWELLSDGSIIGVRRRIPADGSKASLSSKIGVGGKVRRRLPRTEKCHDRLGCWEAWTVAASGRWATEECRPLLRDGEQLKHLIINELGPRVRVGQMSILVGFGNAIKLISLGHERFEHDADETRREPLINMSSRRRRGGPLPRARISNIWPS